MVTECTPKTLIPWKFFTTIELSIVTEKRKAKIDQVESRSIGCGRRKRSYADISRFCAIVDYFSGVKISVAIKLIEEVRMWVISTTYEQKGKNTRTIWMARAKVIFSSNRALGDISLQRFSNEGPSFSSTKAYTLWMWSNLVSMREGHPFIGDADRILYTFLSVWYSSSK